MTDYQLLPDLTPEEYAALKADIGEHGVLVPVEVDEAGNVLDGHHRIRACAELGLPDPPTVVREGLSEDQKHEHALRLNLQRRHLTGEQKRALIRAELDRDPDRSDRAIGRLVGVDHKTVGTVRRGEIPQPRPINEDAAEAARLLNGIADRAEEVAELRDRLRIALDDGEVPEDEQDEIRTVVRMATDHVAEVREMFSGTDTAATVAHHFEGLGFSLTTASLAGAAWEAQEHADRVGRRYHAEIGKLPDPDTLEDVGDKLKALQARIHFADGATDAYRASKDATMRALEAMLPEGEADEALTADQRRELTEIRQQVARYHRERENRYSNKSGGLRGPLGAQRIARQRRAEQDGES